MNFEDIYKKYISGINLRRAVIKKPNLYRADLMVVDLSGDILPGANLREANLSGANLTGADLRGANLSEVDLTGADLSEANLRGADLTRANLTEANLYGANLSGADLTRANLREANLSEANLSGADLREANLSEVDLTGAYLVDIITDKPIILLRLSKHPLQFNFNNNELRIGCEVHSFDYWLENIESIGLKNKYLDHVIETYKQQIEMIIKANL